MASQAGRLAGSIEEETRGIYVTALCLGSRMAHVGFSAIGRNWQLPSFVLLNLLPHHLDLIAHELPDISSPSDL